MQRFIEWDYIYIITSIIISIAKVTKLPIASNNIHQIKKRDTRKTKSKPFLLFHLPPSAKG